MQLGRFTLAKGASLAPMAGATDTTMRRLCAAHGAVCTVSEMVSAKALTMGDKKSPRLMAGGGGDAPFGVQLFGAQPDVMAEAARLICDMRGKMPFDFIDINMGCPAPKIAGPGAGSALLKDPPLAGAIARAVRDAAPADVPVTVKLRIGWDADTMTGLEVARRCADAGAALLTVHGRTRCRDVQSRHSPGGDREDQGGCGYPCAGQRRRDGRGKRAGAAGGHGVRRRGRGARSHGKPMAVRADRRGNGVPGGSPTAQPARAVPCAAPGISTICARTRANISPCSRRARTPPGICMGCAARQRCGGNAAACCILRTWTV